MVATSNFSGLASSACAFASAAAIAPIDSLERCTVLVRREEIETHRARLRALGSDAVAGCFFCVFRHQGLQLGLGALMVDERRRVAQKRPANSAQELDSFMSTMRTASIRGLGGSIP